MQHYVRSTRGFTLIELLIVIAIIGILSAVVLVSLTSARTKGLEAQQKRDLLAMRTQSELYVDANGNSYLGLCAASPTTVNGTKNLYDMLVAYKNKYEYDLNVAATAGNSTTVSCKISMLLASFPDKSVFGMLNGGAKVQGGSSAKDIALSSDDCVSAVVESLIATKIVPTIKTKAGIP